MKIVLFVLLVWLGACSQATVVGPGHSQELLEFLPVPPGPILAVIHVVDEDGRPFRPDHAWWYYPPDEEGRAEEVLSRCLDRGCTRWGVTGAKGRIYVGASVTRAIPNNAYCWITGYDARPVELSASSVPEVTLRLDRRESCYES
jgi:hypothetical protein